MQAHFRRIRVRRGPKKAAIAVAHSLFVRCFMLASNGTSYQELGGSYFDERRKEALTQRLIRRLETLGYAVSLKANVA